MTDFGKLPVKVDDIFLSLWQGYRCCVCVLNYIWGNAPEKAVGNTDDFSFCLPGPVAGTALIQSVEKGYARLGPVINANMTLPVY